MRALALGLVFTSFGSVAAAQTCGQPYMIDHGDTLGSLATTVYGDRSYYRTIFNANSGKIGETPTSS